MDKKWLILPFSIDCVLSFYLTFLIVFYVYYIRPASKVDVQSSESLKSKFHSMIPHKGRI